MSNWQVFWVCFTIIVHALIVENTVINLREKLSKKFDQIYNDARKRYRQAL
jgi:hypothetical protein